MARGVNKVILLGNVANEPDFRTLPSNSASVATVSLATNESFRDQQGQMQDRVEWHRLVFWGRLAEIVRDYVRKGSMIYVEGKIRTRSYDDKQGVKKYLTEIMVQELQMLGSKNGNNQQGNFSNPSDNFNGNQSSGYNQQSNFSGNQNSNYSNRQSNFSGNQSSNYNQQANPSGQQQYQNQANQFNNYQQNNTTPSNFGNWGNNQPQQNANVNMPDPNSFKVGNTTPEAQEPVKTQLDATASEPSLHPFADDDIPF